MKKNLSLMLAAILTCGSMFIACSNDVDNPVIPTPDPIITGEWFAIVNISDYDEDSDEDRLPTTDSSSVVVRAWQLPDSTGYLYYVAHQNTYVDMLPLWTTLIYSQNSLSSKFIHKNYRVEYFWPNDMRY